MAFRFKKTIRLDPNEFRNANIEMVAEALERVGRDIEETAKHLCPVDQGHLRASIQHRMIEDTVLQVGTSEISYASAVEFGSMPHTPPIEPIRKWAERHGIPEATWPIWNKIRTHGTQPRPYLRPAIHKHTPEVQEHLRRAMVKAAKRSTRR